MKVNIKCEQHPKYKAVGAPMCEACKVLYWLKEDGFRAFSDGSRLCLVKTRKKP